MPASVRQTYKRELDRAVGNIDSALSHLMGVIEAYKEGYPQIAEPLTALAGLLMESQNAITEVNKLI